MGIWGDACMGMPFLLLFLGEIMTSQLLDAQTDKWCVPAPISLIRPLKLNIIRKAGRQEKIEYRTRNNDLRFTKGKPFSPRRKPDESGGFVETHGSCVSN